MVNLEYETNKIGKKSALKLPLVSGTLYTVHTSGKEEEKKSSSKIHLFSEFYL